jgi:hypothetical protein
VFYNDKVIYSVNNTTCIGNQYYKPGDMFRFTEPYSGQFLKQSNGIFSPPRRHPYFGVVVGLVWSNDTESYAGSSVCYR